MSRASAAAVNTARQNGGRVIAIGTTVVRALATVTDDRGVVHPGHGWTEAMVTPDTPVRSVDGLRDRMARTGVDPPADAGGVRRPPGARAGLPGRARRRLPVARVRRQPPRRPREPDAVSPTDDRATADAPARRPPRGALRRAPAGRGDRRAGRRAARHHRQRRAAAPQHAGTTTVSSRPASCRRRRPSGVDARSCTRQPAAADAYFPKAYGELTNELLGYVADTDRALLDDLFAKRREARIAGARVRLATKRTLGARVAELTRILDEDGYLATFERRRSPASTGSSSTTARSGRSPSATARRARVSSSSSAPCSRAPTSNASSTWWPARRRCAYEVRAR